MTTFTIDSADHIEHTTGNRKPDAGDHFSSLDELGQLAELWPAARLVRIWKALQNGGSNSAAKSKTRRKNGARSNKAAARAGTKKAHIVRLLQRPNGATVAEIMRATDWQPHTVRGFVSRALVHDLGLQVARFKREKGQPAYRLQRQKRD